MKISELMLDMATGDASAHDVAIQEAAGKVKVSTAIFEASYKISELAGSPSSMIVQEAAEVGLPTEKEEACGVACEAVNQQLAAYLDVVAATAKKIKGATDKELKLFATLGKKFGVNASNKTNFSVAFATPFAKSVINDNGKKPIELSGNKFLKAKYSAKLAAAYCKGVAKILAAYDVSINDVFADPTIAAEYGKHTSKEGATSMKEVASYLSDGANAIGSFDKIISKERHYTDTVKEADIASMITSLYIIIAASSAVDQVVGKGSDRKAAVANAKDLCEKDCSDDKAKKKISTTLQGIGTDMNSMTDAMTAIATNITKGFTDSTYSLMEALNGGSAAPATADTAAE